MNSHRFQNGLENLHSENPIDILCFTGEVQKSLLLLHSMKKILAGTRAAVYSGGRQGIGLLTDELKNCYKDVFLFGDGEEILGEAIKAEADLKKKAISFNAEYNRLASKLMGGNKENEDDKNEYEVWNRLNALKKESSMKLLMHSSTKQKLLEFYKDRYSFDGSAGEFAGMLMRKIEGEELSVQADIIERDELMNELAAIEHRRWCNFYLQKNFVYNEKKDESLLRHDCLITDWDVFLQSDKRDTIVYDFISWGCYKD